MYQAVQNVEKDWQRYSSLVTNVLECGGIANFLRSQVIIETLYFMPADDLIETLARHPDWETRWIPAIEDDRVGNPIPCNSYYNGNVLHQAAHLMHFLGRTKCKLEDLNNIYEFGAGYGCMCRLIHKLGFAGRYVINDLPAMLKLQQYYLGESLSDTKITYMTGSDEFAGQMEGKSLFIGNWSLSEVDFLLRDKILDAVYKKVDYIFIGFQCVHGRFNNLEYFVALSILAHPEYRWDLFVVPHATANRQPHCYLFGVKQW
jgi:hypothetical protein